ncbi:ribosome maturation factor RimM [Pseudogracilibacillus sp. SE30717A]|uniref:ribosome maturation factor RimM n=1 Tax=Pseudogracilibacillus sp. SE30717A TaxID=3098293 RepID=UPI00300E4D40
MFVIGKIINTHGIKGEVKVKQISDFPERFKLGSTVYLTNHDDELITLKIAGMRLHKGFLLLQFEGYESINDVEHLKGVELKIKEEQQEPLGENEYYYHQIIGCNVVTTEGEEIGIIESILSPGANDVWVIRGKNNQEILIPYIEPVVKDVNVEGKQVIIELMEGLID